MPKTKMGTLPRQMSRVERDAMIVRGAFARHGIFRQTEMARLIGAGEATISKALKHGMSASMIFRIHAFVEFTPEEREELLWQKL